MADSLFCAVLFALFNISLEVEETTQKEELLSEKEKANQLIDKVRLDCDIKIEEYRNKLDEFQKVNQNSTLNGHRGEDLMYNMLVEQFPGCQIDTHTSKESHKGDFSLIENLSSKLNFNTYFINFLKRVRCVF